MLPAFVVCSHQTEVEQVFNFQPTEENEMPAVHTNNPGSRNSGQTDMSLFSRVCELPDPQRESTWARDF